MQQLRQLVTCGTQFGDHQFGAHPAVELGLPEVCDGCYERIARHQLRVEAAHDFVQCASVDRLSMKGLPLAFDNDGAEQPSFMSPQKSQHGVQKCQFLELVRIWSGSNGAPNIRALDKLRLNVGANFVRPRLTVVVSLRQARVLPRHFGDVARVECSSCDDQERLNLRVEST